MRRSTRFALLTVGACVLAAAAWGSSFAFVDAKDVSGDVLGPLLHKLSQAQLGGGLSAASALRSSAPRLDIDTQARLDLFVKDAEFINSLASWMLPAGVRGAMSHFLLGWFRNWVFGLALYFALGSLWAYYVYFCFGRTLFPDGNVPTLSDMLEQMKVSFLAMPGYALLPAVTEYVVEKGYTQAFARVDEVGLAKYVGLFFLYMTCVEFGVYWSHRLLHVGWGYKLLHAIHHIYNKEHSLSPFAGLAFHTLDGVMQALPYSLTMFIVPMHALTHLILLFLTGVWTTNIHDNVDGMMEPIMGSGYHTIHHTTYKDNYGHYTIYMDWLFGTLITPEEYEARVSKNKTSKSD